MEVPNVDKKLREARFFLSKLSEQEDRAFGEKEPFDFYLSAFLSAARSVEFRLEHEHAALYKPWRVNWKASLAAPQANLVDFLIKDRNVEIHRSGSRRDQKIENIPVGNMYSDASGTAYCSAPPGTPPAMIHKPVYDFTIDGTERKATEACGEYLRLLEVMVAKFKADNP